VFPRSRRDPAQQNPKAEAVVADSSAKKVVTTSLPFSSYTQMFVRPPPHANERGTIVGTDILTDNFEF
jgi:hypothetical protein